MDADHITSLVRLVELKDASTAAHTWRVALYAKTMAEALGEPPERVDRYLHAAVLHDIGKLDIPDHILRKPEALTDEEFAIIKRHTTLGHERLIRMGETDPIILSLVRSHHERLDGSGYPDGLRGEDIPLAARVFAVIDSFDAMTSLRPYRPRPGDDAAEKAAAELEAGAGIRYAPEAVRFFNALLGSGRFDWILHHFNDEASVASIETVPRPGVVRALEQRLTR